MNNKFTVRQFNYRFPDDDACLEEIKVMRFGEMLDCPNCGKNNKFYKIEGRKAYSCGFCRHQIHPLAGTIFEKSSTPLQDWFYAIYLMAQTRAGISAKQLERMLGVTYKTAWRMFHQIRKLMADDEDMLSGEVEVDETYVGGKSDGRGRTKGRHIGDKAVVMGMVERQGRAKVRHVKSSGSRSLIPELQAGIKGGSQIYSDQYPVYINLDKLGYKHASVNHQTNFAIGLTHTQNVENLWSHIKRGIIGVYRHVDPKYLQSYVDEYAFRYSHRKQPHGAMFDSILSRVC
ncbi:MAG TPA: IS1595 family transposase [Candidatus Saccharimonadales bacterium]